MITPPLTVTSSDTHNLSGLCKIHICTVSQENGGPYDGAIQGLVLEFEQEATKPPVYLLPVMLGVRSSEIEEKTLEIDRNDSIVAVEIRMTESQVRAIRFELKSGVISKFYGNPGYVDGLMIECTRGPDSNPELQFVNAKHNAVLMNIDFSCWDES